jgi:hypothetical protein
MHVIKGLIKFLLWKEKTKKDVVVKHPIENNQNMQQGLVVWVRSRKPGVTPPLFGSVRRGKEI